MLPQFLIAACLACLALCSSMNVTIVDPAINTLSDYELDISFTTAVVAGESLVVGFSNNVVLTNGVTKVYNQLDGIEIANYDVDSVESKITITLDGSLVNQTINLTVSSVLNPPIVTTFTSNATKGT